jgi:acid phosphatase type 7
VRLGKGGSRGIDPAGGLVDLFKPLMRIPSPIIVLLVMALFPLAVLRGGIEAAADYPGTGDWIDEGHRGHVDFGMWSLEAVHEEWAGAGWFIGDSTQGGGNINTDGRSFALYANPAGDPMPYAAATLPIAKGSLTTGDTLGFRISVNYRNGLKGVSLRNASGASVWNFTVGNVTGAGDGYHVRNGDSSSAPDDGQRLGAYHADTVFAFTFVQRERVLEWTVARTGGVQASVSGQLAIDSGTVVDARCFISGTDGGSAPENNLYFNEVSLVTAARGDAPLTLGERRLPGRVPTFDLRFVDPVASSVTMRHSGDWNTSHPLTKGGDGVWRLDVRTLGLAPGWHEFKFRLNSVYEAGLNRFLHLGADGRIVDPLPIYLTWQRDPCTTMTVHWHNHDPAGSGLRWRVPGASDWNVMSAATSVPQPWTERTVHTAEIAGLEPDWVYEFEVDGHVGTYRFRTMPATLERPLVFGVAGDVDVGDDADAMARAMAGANPSFVVLGGDLAYSFNGSEPPEPWKWHRFFDSWFEYCRSEGDLLIPMVVGIGNHEVRYGWSEYHADFDDTDDWRLRYAPDFFRLFAFPGTGGFGALVFGSYLSLLVLDTEHATPLITGSDRQSAWLAAELDRRRAVPHLLPIYHIPAHPSNRDPSDARHRRIRDHWVPLFEQAGVKAAFEFHDHTFKRTKPLLGGVENTGGIVFLGDGAWGVSLRQPDQTRTNLAVAEARHHAFLVEITSQGRRIRALDKNGVVFDDFTQSIDGFPASPSATVSGLNDDELTLSWEPIANADAYRILRDGEVIATTTSTSHADAGWSAAANCTVVATNRSGASPASSDVAASPRQVWRLENGLAWDGAGEAGDSADPDGDGMPNLLEYFFGRIPTVADAGGQYFSDMDGGEFSLTYQKNKAASDVSGRVVWIDVPAGGEWSGEGITDAWDSDAGDHEWRKAAVSVEPGERSKFLRIEVGEP